MTQGFQPNLCSPYQISAVTKLTTSAPLDIPNSYKTKTSICIQMARYTTQLDGVQDPGIQHSLITMFDGDLETLREQPFWSNTLEAELNLQAAKIYLYSFVFTSDSGSRSRKINNSPAFKLMLQKGHASACKLINTGIEIDVRPITTFECPHIDGGTSRLLYYPKWTLYTIFMATIFLLKYLVSLPDALSSDRETAINHITMAHKFFSQFKTGRDHKRAAMIIELLGRMTRSGVGSADVRIKSRMGASILYDATLQCYSYRTKHGSTPLDSAAWQNFSDLGGTATSATSAAGLRIHARSVKHHFVLRFTRPLTPTDRSWLELGLLGRSIGRHVGTRYSF